jgi:hypothetical protein
MAKRVKSINRAQPELNEPTFKSTEPQAELVSILNWYSYNKDSDDAKTYFLTYLKKYDMDVFDKLKTKASEIRVPTTIGWLCRIYTLNESLFPLRYLKHIKDETTRVLQVVSTPTESEPVETKQRIGVQEHLNNQLKELLGELDCEIDEFVLNGCTSTFSLYDWLQHRKVKHVHAKSIADYYERNILAELKQAHSGSCEQLQEAYSFLSKIELNSFISFIEGFVEDANRWQGIAKQISSTNRVPRKRKAKPAAKQVEKLQYLKEHENLKSILPSQIVGATQLWVYNVKYKTLGVYICNNAHGFMVKGCTILNYDLEESISKTLRKPEDVLPSVLEAGKVALRKILPSLRTKEKKLTGRINKDTLLLRVL